jgi:hypothetical protein
MCFLTNFTERYSKETNIWGFWSFGMWHFVDGCVVCDVLKDLSAFIFEDKSTVILPYFWNLLSNDKMLHPRRLECLATLLWEDQILQWTSVYSTNIIYFWLFAIQCNLSSLSFSTPDMILKMQYEWICVTEQFFCKVFCVYSAKYLFQHLFASTHSTELRQKMIDMAVKYIGIGIRVLKDPITLDEFSAQRLGKFRLVRLQFYVHVQHVEVYVSYAEHIMTTQCMISCGWVAMSPGAHLVDTDLYLNLEAGCHVCLLISISPSSHKQGMYIAVGCSHFHFPSRLFTVILHFSILPL